MVSIVQRYYAARVSKHKVAMNLTDGFLLCSLVDTMTKILLHKLLEVSALVVL